MRKTVLPDGRAERRSLPEAPRIGGRKTNDRAENALKTREAAVFQPSEGEEDSGLKPETTNPSLPGDGSNQKEGPMQTQNDNSGRWVPLKVSLTITAARAKKVPAIGSLTSDAGGRS